MNRSDIMKAAWSRIKAGDGFLYLAEVGGHIKIGFSTTPAQRCMKMGGKMLAHMPGTMAQEKALHQKLRAVSIKDETYRRSVLNHPALPEGLRPAPADAEAEQYDPELLKVGIKAPKYKKPRLSNPLLAAERSKRFGKYLRSLKTTAGITNEQNRLDGMYRAVGHVVRG